MPASEQMEQLSEHKAILIPARAGKLPRFTFTVAGDDGTELQFQLRKSSRSDAFTPDEVLERQIVKISATRQDAPSQSPARGANGTGSVPVENAIGSSPQPTVSVISKKVLSEVKTPRVSIQEVSVEFTTELAEASYVFCCLMANPEVSIVTSDHLVTGLTTVVHRQESRVSKGAKQLPPDNIGIDAVEFWTPRRRPEGRNPAMRCDPPLENFSPQNVCNGIARPWHQANAWVADPNDDHPQLVLSWESIQVIDRIELSFDTDFDHPMESTLMGHPEHVMPCCVREFSILGHNDTPVYSCADNHQTRRIVQLPEPIMTDRLTLQLRHPSELAPASLFEVRCYGPGSRDAGGMNEQITDRVDYIRGDTTCSQGDPPANGNVKLSDGAKQPIELASSQNGNGILLDSQAPKARPSP